MNMEHPLPDNCSSLGLEGVGGVGMQNSTDESLKKVFRCVVCLDMTYKPVVLPCGHMHCFWCTHNTMDIITDSKCPQCNQGYRNFPRICGFVHMLLQKLFSEEYGRREEEVFEQEQAANRFSSEVAISMDNNDDMEKLSLKDVLCPLCEELLCHPISLICGHVFCNSCLLLDDGASLKCPKCEVVNPGGLPNICKPIDQFLEKYFHKEHSARRIKIQQSLQGLSSGSLGNIKMNSGADVQEGECHVGVGCDCCGIYPICGPRYKCQECKDLSGFDLCEKCYLLQPIPEGRFNQTHSAEHDMMLDDSLSYERVAPYVKRFSETAFPSDL